MHLFIQSLLTEDYADLKFKLMIVAIMWLMVAVAVAFDLVSGWQKAKERGEARTSYGLRRTVSKTVLYYAMMLFAFMFDGIGMFFYPLPYVTFIASAFLIFIECKSILEKAHDKDKRKIGKSLEELSILFENKDELVKALSDIIKKYVNDKSDSNDEND